MKPIYIFVIVLVPVLAMAGEKLPDSAKVNPPDNSRARQDHFSGSPLDNREMERLYLKSPVDLGDPVKNKGMSSMSDDKRFGESDQQLFRERRQSQGANTVPSPNFVEPEQAPLPTPVRQL